MVVVCAASYSYLLGLYLGDGHLNDTRGAFQLRISLDAAYPEIVAECAETMRVLFPGNKVSVRDRKGWRVKSVDVSRKDLVDFFPQHGKGRKHERPIALASWQRNIVDSHPQDFLRGLIHSDGCRSVNRFEVALPSGRIAEYAYPRYFFSNLSADIRALFCEYCERLGVRWTQPNHRNISVSHRESVALLDRFVGPKK